MKIKRVISKTGKVYEYDASKYVYKHKSTRGLTLVGKNGRVYEKNIEKLKSMIDANDKYSAAEKTYLKADLDAFVKVKKLNKERLTSSGFFGRLESDSVTRMFVNAGYSPDDVSALYDIDKDALLDETNWSGDVFIYGGKMFRFNFTYTGDIFSEVI